LHGVTEAVNSFGLLGGRGSKARPALPIALEAQEHPNIRRARSFALFKHLWKKQDRKGVGERIFFQTVERFLSNWLGIQP